MINALIKKTAQSFNKESVSKEISQPAPAIPKPEPAPIDSSPRGLAKVAAEAAGFEVGKEYQALTTKHRPANKRLLWCKLDGWGEPVLYSVNNSADWQPAERIWGVYAGPDAQGRLQFENRDGVRRNRWKARS